MIIAVALFAILLVVGGCGVLQDYWAWNNGTCRRSSLPWRQFGSHPQKGRGYADGKGNQTWQWWGCDLQARSHLREPLAPARRQPGLPLPSSAFPTHMIRLVGTEFPESLAAKITVNLDRRVSGVANRVHH